MSPQFLFLLISVLFLGACTETQLVSHVVKTNLPGGGKSEGDFKVGSPYKVAGKWYRPEETYNYTETGIASWYGPNFHGKPTANGERFDMNELTAAHKTLQLPSLVRVTNLENGRSLVVRVNDRGPFKRGRIIDLSKRSAELLGFKGKGTAKVKIQVLAEESQAMAFAAKRGEDTRGIEVAMNENRTQEQTYPRRRRPGMTPPPVPEAQVQPAAGQAGQASRPLPTLPQQPPATLRNASLQPVQREALQAPSIPGHVRDGKFLPDPVVSQVPVSPTSIYVQAGSFGDQGNAVRLAQNLQNFGNAQVYPATVNGKQFYRVRLGPVADVDKADLMLDRLAMSGQSNAIIVVD